MEAVEYYESQRLGLGAALDADLDRALQFISDNPRLGSPSGKDTRRVLLDRFPYGVVYRTLADRVMVVAFAHLKRRPGYWSGRL